MCVFPLPLDVAADRVRHGSSNSLTPQKFVYGLVKDKTSLFTGWNMAEGLLYVKERINTACCVAENQDGPESVTQNVEHHVEGVLWA